MPSTPRNTNQPAPAVIIQDLIVERGQTQILRGVNATLPAGQCTALLGPNGCGKTTLTRCMTGYTFVTSGSVHVLGQEIGSTDVRTLRRRIGLVNPTLDVAGAHISGATVDADLSAHEAVCTGFFGTIGLYEIPTPEQHDRAEYLLHQVGLKERSQLRFALLSHGEQRRAMLARAMAHKPELLILDEPSAGLDVAGREQVLATIETVLAGPQPPTVLMITHHVEEISPRTAQVLLMRKGKIVAAGPPKEIITPESLSRTFGCKVFVRRLHGRWWLEVLPEAWIDLLPPAGGNL